MSKAHDDETLNPGHQSRRILALVYPTLDIPHGRGVPPAYPLTHETGFGAGRRRADPRTVEPQGQGQGFDAVRECTGRRIRRAGIRTHNASPWLARCQLQSMPAPLFLRLGPAAYRARGRERPGRKDFIQPAPIAKIRL